MACEPSKVGDTPTLIAELVQVSDSLPLDVSGATTKTIYVTDPLGDTVAHTAAFTTDGIDGRIQVTLAALPNRPGIWRYEGFVILSGSRQFTGKETTFVVVRSKFGDAQ